MPIFKNEKVKNAVFIGSLCSVSYLAVYFARNILSAVTPQMIGINGITTEYIGDASSLYFITYAIGQLINGIIGDRIKARYMLSFGLLLAGVCCLVFPMVVPVSLLGARVVYGMTGFFLAMIYGPMTKVVAENTEPVYATRCSLGYTFSSFFGSPLAGIVAAAAVWQSTFYVGAGLLIVMAMVCYGMFLYFEKRGIVRYGQYKRPEKTIGGGSIRLLIRYRIIKFIGVAILTGVVRTTVVFWLPTYIAQYLGFTPEESAALFTVATLAISASAFISIFLYERLGHNMDLTLLISFIASAVCFLLVFFLRAPIPNILFMVLAILSANCASTMLWSRYCPSLRDTGMVSGATGFLDFVGYLSAGIASTLFANAVADIGWGNLILVWFGLMAIGVVISLPFRRKATANGAQ